MRRLVAGVVALLCLFVGGCGSSKPKTELERTVTDNARGVRYVVPQGWKSWDGEIRSPAGSMLTLRVYDLVEADKKFVAGLPETLVPQLTEWAKWYYKVDGDPVRTQTTVAGAPATEFVYPVRVLPRDPQSKVIYWVVRHRTRLFVLRAAFPAKALAEEEPVVRKVVADWAFVGEGGPAG